MDAFSNLTAFDWLTITAISLLAVRGGIRGFTNEALSLAAWVMGAVMVRMFHQGVTLWLQSRFDHAALAASAAFVILFFGTVLVVRITASIAGSVARNSPAGAVDRVLGFGFGGLKGVLVMSAVFVLAQFATGLFDLDREQPRWLRDSRSAPVLSLAADTMVGWIQQLRQRTIAGNAPTRGPQMRFPPGHPPFGPQFGPPERDEGGYSQQDREALDRLLDEGARKGGQVDI